MPVMKKKAASASDLRVRVPKLQLKRDKFSILGLSGLYCHRMTQKAANDLLLGGRKKTAAEKVKIKHHPREEFRASMFLSLIHI